MKKLIIPMLALLLLFQMAPKPLANVTEANVTTENIEDTINTTTVNETDIKLQEDIPAENAMIPSDTPSCEGFSITIKDMKEQPKKNVKVTVVVVNDINKFDIETLTTDAEGKITIPSTLMDAYSFHLFEGHTYLGAVNVGEVIDCHGELIEKNQCESSPWLLFQGYSKEDCNTKPEPTPDSNPKPTPTPIPSCPNFTITSVYDVNGNQFKKGEVILKQAGKEVAKSTINKDGKVSFTNLSDGTYEVYVGKENLGEFKVNKECQISIEPEPTYEYIEVVIKNIDGTPRPDVNITVTDVEGNVVAEDLVTNKDGVISIETSKVEAGKDYNLYEGKLYLGTITIDFKKPQMDLSYKPVCILVTATVKNQNGEPQKNIQIEMHELVNGKVGKMIATGTTNNDGEVILENTQLPKGKYAIFEVGADFNNNLNTVTIDSKCSSSLTLKASDNVLPNVKPVAVEKETLENKNLPQTNGDTQVLPVVIGFILAIACER